MFSSGVCLVLFLHVLQVKLDIKGDEKGKGKGKGKDGGSGRSGRLAV